MSLEILDRVSKACKNHTIHQVLPIGSFGEGHYGVKVILSKKEVCFSCEVLEIGIVMYYYGTKNGYFTDFVNEDLRKQIDNYNKNSCNLI